MTPTKDTVEVFILARPEVGDCKAIYRSPARVLEDIQAELEQLEEGDQSLTVVTRSRMPAAEFYTLPDFPGH